MSKNQDDFSNNKAKIDQAVKDKHRNKKDADDRAEAAAANKKAAAAKAKEKENRDIQNKIAKKHGSTGSTSSNSGSSNNIKTGSKDNNTLYNNSMRTQNHEMPKSNKADEHNLRLDPENPNYDPELEKNNVYLCELKLGEIKPIPNNQTQKLKERVNKIVEKEKQLFYKDCDADCGKMSQATRDKKITERSNLKNKFKKWIANEKTPEKEKQILQDCLNILDNKEQGTDKQLNQFRQLTDKVLRRNDKIKAISRVKDFNNIADLKNRNLSKKIITNEIVFKIPDKNNISVSAEHWEVLTKHFKNKYFPNNRMLFAAIHADENPDNLHVHLKLSGYNYKTKNYDIPDHEIELLKNHLKNTDKPYPIKNKKWAEYNSIECKQHGKLYQDFIFEKMNMYLSKMGYDVDFKKRTAAQILEDDHDYQKTLKSTNREHNRQNKLNEALDIAEIKAQEIVDELNQDIQKLENKRSEANTDVYRELSKKEAAKNQLDLVNLELEEKKHSVVLIGDLIKELPLKINQAITAIGKYLKSNFAYSEELDKEDKIEKLSNHLDKLENINEDFNTTEIVEALVFQTETSDTNKNIIFDQLNAFEKNKNTNQTNQNNNKTKTRTKPKRSFGM